MEFTYSAEVPTFDRNESRPLGVTLNSFDVCNDEISQMERLRIEEFRCLKLKADPSNRTELVVCKSTFDILKSFEKMSFSSGAKNY